MQTKTNRFQWLGVFMVVMVGLVTLLMSEAAHSTKPAVSKEGGYTLAMPDTCHLPAPPPPAGPGGIPTPYPNKENTPLSKADQAKAKKAFEQKKTSTKKPAKADIDRLNMWLDFMDAVVYTLEESLKNSTAPKNQIAAAHKALKKMRAAIAEGRAATKNSKTTGDMYKKFSRVQTKLQEIDYPAVLRKPMPLKWKKESASVSEPETSQDTDSPSAEDALETFNENGIYVNPAGSGTKATKKPTPKKK